ncbi:MAG: hypothetical protein ACLPKI_30455 [Streptosporangiaceae bacterium]
MNHATTAPRPAPWATARTAAAAAAVTAAAAAAITGCSAAPSQPAASASKTATSASKTATSPAAPASTPAGTPAAAPSTPTASAVATASSQPPATAASAATPATPAPVLGQLAGVFAQGQGFGQAEPPKIFNGGDPTGLVQHIHWTSWGGAQAIGHGMAEWVGPNQTVATGTQKPATVIAFRLGTCGGKLMYQAVEWYFPGEHQSFSARHYENVCTGSYLPSS